MLFTLTSSVNRKLLTNLSKKSFIARVLLLFWYILFAAVVSFFTIIGDLFFGIYLYTVLVFFPKKLNKKYVIEDKVEET